MSDVIIGQAVRERLGRDGRLAGATIAVAVDEGVVTLTGIVRSGAQVLAAQETAHRVAGALDVANELRLRVASGVTAPDTCIAQAVRQALRRQLPAVEPHIRSTVTDGRVTLEGRVAGWPQREAAERVVRGLAGVRGVTNRLSVRVAPALVAAGR